ncbi:MAG: DUF5010 domain-containing protein [Planctomycetota bacterium]
MTMINAVTHGICVLLSVGVVVGAEVEIPALPDADALAAAPSFTADDAVVATHYFYWYRWPDKHFFDDAERTDDVLRHHFPDHREVSYESTAWHRRQMEDMQAAGIDVVLCIYWGAPENYAAPGLNFSVQGIPPLVAALDELARAGDTPRVAMFYDTSTLLGVNAFGKAGAPNVDLRTPVGRDIFYRTIRDFYRLVPPRHWACLDGRPIVQLYNSVFAAGHDQGVIDYVYEQFAKDFAGKRPFIISGPSWSLETDARTGWGAALNGPIMGTGIVQVGPGYDDSPVPGRTTPTRDRLDGGFYAASWLLALQARPRMVIIETWSELHEGTGICESLEDGRKYIELTRHFSDLYKARQMPSGDDWAGALRLLLNARNSQRGGREFASHLTLEMRVEPDGEVVERGLRLCRDVGDGLFHVKHTGEMACVQTRRGATDHRYLYFDIADPYYYDHSGTLTLKFEYFDESHTPILVQYDSAYETLDTARRRQGQAGTLADCYHEHPQPVARGGTKTWKTATVMLSSARCANRQNGAADFRLASIGSDLTVRRVSVTKLPADYGEE